MSRCAPWFAAALGLIALAGCATVSLPPPSAGPAAGARNPAGEPAASSPLGSPFADRDRGAATPLILDRTDLRIGTTVHYRRLPSPSELHDLNLLPGLARIVLSFDSWPREYAGLDVLQQVPQGVEVVVVLRGWPPGRAAAEMWNYLTVPLRVVVVVPGPPPGLPEVTSVNLIRGLERVIAEMDQPSTSGFERLQRPLGFRQVME
jgi:hypothetical protein